MRTNSNQLWFVIMINVREILMSTENVVLQLSSKDLHEFAKQILHGTKSIAMLEVEAAATSDQLLTIDEAA